MPLRINPALSQKAPQTYTPITEQELQTRYLSRGFTVIEQKHCLCPKYGNKASTFVTVRRDLSACEACARVSCCWTTFSCFFLAQDELCRPCLGVKNKSMYEWGCEEPCEGHSKEWFVIVGKTLNIRPSPRIVSAQPKARQTQPFKQSLSVPLLADQQ